MAAKWQMLTQQLGFCSSVVAIFLQQNKQTSSIPSWLGKAQNICVAFTASERDARQREPTECVGWLQCLYSCAHLPRRMLESSATASSESERYANFHCIALNPLTVARVSSVLQNGNSSVFLSNLRSRRDEELKITISCLLIW